MLCRACVRFHVQDADAAREQMLVVQGSTQARLQALDGMPHADDPVAFAAFWAGVKKAVMDRRKALPPGGTRRPRVPWREIEDQLLVEGLDAYAAGALRRPAGLRCSWLEVWLVGRGSGARWHGAFDAAHASWGRAGGGVVTSRSRLASVPPSPGAPLSCDPKSLVFSCQSHLLTWLLS